MHLGQTEDGYAINSYFLDHPEMVMGRNSSESTAHGIDYTVEPLEDVSLAQQLHEAVQHIHGSYLEAELPDLGDGNVIQDTIPADPDVKNYSYALVDGEVYFRENSVMVRPELSNVAKERVKGMIGLRDCVRALIDLQMDYLTPDADIREKQADLNSLYDGFSKKYGLINSKGNRMAFSDDSSYYLLCSLEVLDEDNKCRYVYKAHHPSGPRCHLCRYRIGSSGRIHCRARLCKYGLYVPTVWKVCRRSGRGTPRCYLPGS